MRRLGKGHAGGVAAAVLFLSLLGGGGPVKNAAAVNPAGMGTVPIAHLTIAEGLSSEKVHAVCQDRKGFMWFATMAGLNRYDGREVRVFRNDPDDARSLSHDFCASLLLDRSGRLWVGTIGGGVCRLDDTGTGFVVYRPHADDPHSLGGDSVSCLLEDRAGRLWVGTNDGGVSRYDSERDRFDRFLACPGGVISALHQDRSGSIWAGTRGAGLYVFDANVGDFMPYAVPAGQRPLFQGDQAVMAIADAPGGGLWLGTLDGAIRLDAASGRWVRFQHTPGDPGSLAANQVRSLFTDSGGRLWLGTPRGISRFDAETGRFDSLVHDPQHPDSLSPGIITAFCEDRSGLIWACSFGGGVNRIDLSRALFGLHRLPILAGGKPGVTALLEDGAQQLWIGTDSAGLVHFDRAAGTYRAYNRSSDTAASVGIPWVISLCAAPDGALWLGTMSGGLFRFDPGTGIFSRLGRGGRAGVDSRLVFDMTGDGADGFWLGAIEGGFGHYDPVTDDVRWYRALPDGKEGGGALSVQCLIRDAGGLLWIGTSGAGLVRFDPATEAFQVFRKPAGQENGISSDNVTDLCESRDGLLWIGTIGGGLNRLDRNGNVFSCWTRADGLASNSVMGLTEDMAGHLWISTDHGLTKFDREAGRLVTFGAKDGLQGEEFHIGDCLTLASGEIMVGGASGFNLFDPEKPRLSDFVPPIVITEMRIFNRPVTVGTVVSGRRLLEAPVFDTGRVTLSHRDNLISFGFSAMEFSAPDHNRFAYRLDGFDGDWVMCGNQRRATYTNVPPGRYVFRVKGTNSDGVWNTAGIHIGLTITPPFWQTWPFRILCGLLGVCGIVLILHLRTRHLLEKGRVLEAHNQALNFEMEKRRKAEEERRHLTRAIDQAVEGVLIVSSKDGVIHYVNPAFERITGTRREDLIGRAKVAACFIVEPAQHTAIMAHVRQGRSFVGRFYNQRGAEVVDVRISPVWNAASDLWGSVAIFQDITREAKMERQLQQSQKMEAIGTLAGGIAHDFNNILSGIVGYAELSLMETPPTSSIRLHLERIMSASQRAAALVRQILSFSRHAEHEIKRFNIGDIVREVVRLMRASLPATIDLAVHIAPARTELLGDAGQIHQVLMNLCTNAVQSMGDAGTLTIQVAPIDLDVESAALYPDIAPGGYVKIVISDTGCGMGPEVLERIFEPFYTTKPVGQGTGLGLAVSHGIVKSHGGVISAYSEPGVGTRFHVYLPRVTGTSDDAATVSEAFLPGGKERILIIDDEANVRDVGRRMLERVGYAVTVAADPRAALDLFRGEPARFDLVVTDHTMPGMTGISLTRELLAIRADLPVIMISGLNELIDEEMLRSVGIAAFVKKPFTKRQLGEAVRSVLDRHGAGG